MTIDLSALDPELVMARGHYATVRAAHEDAKKVIVNFCSHLMTDLNHITTLVQPKADNSIDAVKLAAKLASALAAMDVIKEQCALVEELELQRKALKDKAWPK